MEKNVKSNTLEKTLTPGRRRLTRTRRRRGRQRVRWLVGITDRMDMSLIQTRETVKDREAWCAEVQLIPEVRHFLATEQEHNVCSVFPCSRCSYKHLLIHAQRIGGVLWLSASYRRENEDQRGSVNCSGSHSSWGRIAVFIWPLVKTYGTEDAFFGNLNLPLLNAAPWRVLHLFWWWYESCLCILSHHPEQLREHCHSQAFLNVSIIWKDLLADTTPRYERGLISRLYHVLYHVSAA